MTLSTPLLLGLVGFGLALLAVSRRMTVGRWFAVALFCTYLVGAAHFALLPLTFDPLAPEKFGPIEVGRLIELRPFFMSRTDVMPLSQALLNVLLTVPFGFGLPFVFHLRGREVLLMGVLFSFGIELAQLAADALYLALPPWSIDINDVFLNSLGVFVGYGAFRLVSIIYRKTLGPLPIGRGPWAHFHDTLAEPFTPG